MRYKSLFFLFSITIYFSSCKKSKPSESKIGDKESDIYVAGGVGKGGPAAAYWKNGVENVLDTTFTQISSASDIAVAGNDVYVVGQRKSIPCFWKNGVVNDLTAITNEYGRATGIAINGNDVYITGQISNPLTGNGNAVCWKNGIKTNLVANNVDHSAATGIAINGNDIYIVGFISENGSNLEAVLWKNGVINKFPYASNDTRISGNMANCITIIDKNIYIAGDEFYNYQSGLPNSIVCWKNGNVYSSISNANASAIEVKGSDVYIAGSDGKYSAAMYWKNGKATKLNSGLHECVAGGIAVYQGDIYVVGGIGDPLYMYWKNQTPIRLSNYQSAGAGRILIVPR